MSDYDAGSLAVVVVVITPAVAISHAAVAVPAVIVLEATAVTIPVTAVELATFIARANPGGACVRRTGPVAFVPTVTTAVRIPISINPVVVGPWRHRPHPNHTGPRRWTDSDAHSDLRRAEGWRTGKQHAGKKCRSEKLPHHAHTMCLPWYWTRVPEKFSPSEIAGILVARDLLIIGYARYGDGSIKERL
jgi:hypothetical protein